MTDQPHCPACGAPIAAAPEGGLAATCSACGKAWAEAIVAVSPPPSDNLAPVIIADEPMMIIEPVVVVEKAAEAPLVIDEPAIEAHIQPEADAVFISVGPVEETVGQARKLPEGNWYLETPEGLRFGPVTREEIAQWVAEGRVSLDCRLQRSPDLNLAPGDFFPGLKVPPRRPSQSPGVRVIQRPPLPGPKNQPSSVAAPKPASQPEPPPNKPGELTFRTSHRGYWVLLLAICSWATCPILGGFAWAMATHDLQEMQAGRMDMGGEPETSLGMWLGMAHVIVAAVILVIGFIAGSLALALR